MLAPAQSDRAATILRRVDSHLDGLPFGPPRAKFLAGQLDAWELLYAAFLRTDGKSEPSAHATDFAATIAGLSSRLEEARHG